jgi:hypothetical protein
VLTDLHNAIVARLLADVAGLQTCAAYPELDHDSRIAIPGVLIETDSSIEPAKDAGTDQLCLTTRWRAYCIYDPNQPNADLEVRNLAVTVALAIYLASRFGQPVGSAKITSISEDAFKPELDGYFVWAVEWEHDIRVGTSIWDGVGVMPTEINVSFNNDPYEPLPI